MRNTLLRSAACIGIFALSVGCAQPGAAPAGGAAAPAAAAPAAATSNTLTAIKVDAVAADGAAAFWADAAGVTVPTKAVEKGKPDGSDVSLKAAYDGTNFALRLEWADTSNSNVNKPWTWDGSKFARTGELGDRMGVMFAMQNNPMFATKGCAGTCHNSDADIKKWWMGSETEDQSYDLWQWTAAGSNPLGQSNDQWINVQTDPANAESATHADKNAGGGNLSNVNEAKDGPLYMSGKDVAATIILTGEQVAIDTSKLAVGAIIPASVLSPYTGSRGDITASGVWADGKWVVVLMRKLDTGNEDDVVLIPSKSYPLGVGIFDKAEHYSHTVAPEVITLEWK